MAADFDLKPHAEMWRSFTKILTFAAGAVAFSLIMMALILLP